MWDRKIQIDGYGHYRFLPERLLPFLGALLSEERGKHLLNSFFFIVLEFAAIWYLQMRMFPIHFHRILNPHPT